MRLWMVGEIFEGIPSFVSFCVMCLDKKLGEKLVKVFGVEDLLTYLSIGNDKCGFCVWNYCVLFHLFL